MNRLLIALYILLTSLGSVGLGFGIAGLAPNTDREHPTICQEDMFRSDR